MTLNYEEHYMKRISPLTVLTLGSALAMALTACGDGTSPQTGAPVSIKFGTTGGAAAGSAPQYSLTGGARAPSAAQQEDSIIVASSNGDTLVIRDIRLIVDELELEPVETTDCDAEPEPAGCAEFEARLLFVDVPLGAEPITVTTSDVPPGMYDEFEFEVDDLELDADDPENAEETQLAQQLLDRIRNQEGFSDWPEKASMVLVGSFKPAGSTAAEEFRAYFEAEIEVEFDLVPVLEITETGASRSLTVQISPEVWFVQSDGSVMNLAEFDFATTGRLIEFELEIEEGFELEIES